MSQILILNSLMMIITSIMLGINSHYIKKGIDRE